jgi:hypothetical protein
MENVGIFYGNEKKKPGSIPGKKKRQADQAGQI